MKGLQDSMNVNPEKISRLGLQLLVPTCNPGRSQPCHEDTILKFRDAYFLQLIGTEMGTSVTVIVGNQYSGW